jgi:DNA modification methylase
MSDPLTIINADALAALRGLPGASVHCVVTSPPYYGLRDYGTAKWAGGNDPSCTHGVRREWDGAKQTQGAMTGHAAARDRLNRTVCQSCGARRVDDQIGLEASFELYLARLVEVFREVRRVLRPDGTLFVNMGDSYATTGGTGSQGRQGQRYGRRHTQRNIRPEAAGGVKPKDLIGAPWRLAFALRDDGWFLRQGIIWHKPNPMPESVTDRFTKAHEDVFFLAKSARYYFDQDAILEPCSKNTHARLSQDVQNQIGSVRANGCTRTGRPMKAAGRKFDPSAGNKNNASFDSALAIMPKNRNMRSVWTIPAKAFKGAHFATFPPALVRPCILAGCPPGGVVLDPFGGSGTTGMVALELGRRAVLIELNPDYCQMAQARCAALGLALH